jgi:Asp/Glu/hydantoin racemase
VPYIATRAEAALGGAIALEMLAEHAGEADAAVIAAFGDPGLGGARELLTVPVVGLAEAAMLTACMLGRKFTLVTFARALVPWYRECVEYNGLGTRLASIRVADGSFASVDAVQDEMAEEIVRAVDLSAAEDGADVVVLAGAPLAGLAVRIRDRVSLPLVDGVAAAVKQAEALVALRPRKATAGTFQRPAPKPSIGLPPPIARLLAGAG